ncbi:MAG: hypothetical protein WCW14_00285 [Candidatus Paceibacterota bacterium]|jgi:hypothetical protein
MTILWLVIALGILLGTNVGIFSTRLDERKDTTGKGIIIIFLLHVAYIPIWCELLKASKGSVEFHLYLISFSLTYVICIALGYAWYQIILALKHGRESC